MIIAHRMIDEDGNVQVQSLREHSRNVARLCCAACMAVNLGHVGYLIGLLHDMGKAAEPVQRRLSGSPEKYPHAYAGARYLVECLEALEAMEKAGPINPYMYLLVELAATAILWHHSGRKDMVDPFGKEIWQNGLRRGQDDAAYEQGLHSFFEDCCTEEELQEHIVFAVKEIKGVFKKINEAFGPKGRTPVRRHFFIGMLQRFLFSVLVDADWTDTSAFMNVEIHPKEKKEVSWQEEWDELQMREKESAMQRKEEWEKLQFCTEDYMCHLPVNYTIDKMRQKISEGCLHHVADGPGIYRLYVPTGGGKTLTGLRYMIHAAKRQNAKHIFFFVPYKSIIEQNAEVFRKVLGSQNVLEHHSDVVLDSEDLAAMEENKKLLMQMARWQETPCIVSTMVQWLNTLFAGPRSNVRRMAGMAHSILLFDEVQTVPREMVFMFNLAIDFLHKILGCTIILCTATQPDLRHVEQPVLYAKSMDLAEGYEQDFKDFKRTHVVVQTVPGGYTAEGIGDFAQLLLNENRSLLIIVNTKKAAEAVYEEIKRIELPNMELYCLSTNLCTAHRQQVIKDIKKWQAKTDKKQEDRLVCVSTQLIEAGVDLSFSCVIRSMAGLPSVAQAAGRCNRNGESTCRNVYLINCNDTLEDLRRLPDIDDARQVTERIIKEHPQEDLLSPDMIQEYYHIYFNQADKMKYTISLPEDRHKRISLLDLLSTYQEGRIPLQKTWKKEDYNWRGACTMTQAFSLAESHFKAIPDENVSVIVPYEEGKMRIADLLSAKPKAIRSILSKLHPYTVSISQGACKCLEKQHGIIRACDGEVLILQEGYYDPDKGIRMKKGEMDFCFY